MADFKDALQSTVNSLNQGSTLLDTDLIVIYDVDGTPKWKVSKAALSAELSGESYVRVDTLPQTPSAETMGKIYLVGAVGSTTFDRYVTQKNGNDYTWVSLGSTALDLSGYIPTVSGGNGNFPVINGDGKLEDSGIAPSVFDAYAKIDGAYPSLMSGLSENLVDTKGEGSSQVILRRTSCGEESITDDGSAAVKKVVGKSLIWNQKVANNTSFSLVKSTQRTANIPISKAPIGHKCLFSAKFSNTVASSTSTNHLGIKYNNAGNEVAAWPIADGIVKCIGVVDVADSTQLYVYIYNPCSDSTAVTISNINFIDLTLLFGAGNEPSTVEEFEAMFPESYYPYDAGSPLNVAAQNIVTDGFNQWDEEWEVGAVANATGENENISGRIRSKNHIPVFPSTNYYCHFGGTGTTRIYSYFYDVDKNYIGRIETPIDGKVFETPAKAHYMRFCSYGGTLNTYNNDICINLSWSGYRNGEYEPYWKQTKALGLTTAKSGGNVVFADGLKSAGTVYDEMTPTKAIKRIGVVDLGSLTWTKYGTYHGFNSSAISDAKANSGTINILCVKYTPTTARGIGTVPQKCICWDINSKTLNIVDSTYDSSDVAAFKSAMNGVLLYYELATYQELPLDEELNWAYKVADFGTETIDPQVDNNGRPVTLPLTAIIKYNDDFTRTIVNLPKNYIGMKELPTLARINGVYPQMVVGASQNLVGRGSVMASYTRRTSGGTADLGSGGATVQSFMGNSIVWNQLISVTAIPSRTTRGVTFTNNGDGSMTLNGTATENAADIYQYQFIQGHKYYLPDKWSGKNVSMRADNDVSWNVSRTGIFESTTQTAIIIIVQSGETADNATIWPQIFDLTLMFGAGKEPATVAEFEAMFPLNYYKYDAGRLLNLTADGIVTTGFNQWDEEWELGRFDYANGAKSDSTTTIRSKNYIPVFPNTTYYRKNPYADEDSNHINRACFYDKDKNYIGGSTGWTEFGGNGVFTTPANAYYMRFYVNTTTYNNDICINLSWSGYRDGEYEQYWSSKMPLPITTLTGKKDGEGESVVIFPEGLKSAGNVRDEIQGTKAIKRIGMVDLGTLYWSYSSVEGHERMISQDLTSVIKGADNSSVANVSCTKFTADTPNRVYAHSLQNIIAVTPSGEISIYSSTMGTDTAAFKTAMSGVMLYYELATPEIYELDEPLNMGYRVDDFGTEAITPENTDEPTTAPIVYAVQYAMNAVDEMRNLGKNYAKKETIESLLSGLQSAGLIASGWAVSYDSTNDRLSISGIAQPTNS